MKNVLNKLVAILIITTTIACKDAPKADEAVASAPDEVVNTEPAGVAYNADIQKSTVAWVGTKPTGRHHGNFNLQSGNLNIVNNTITGGSFVIDINSISVFDEDGSANAKLQKHLKSEDFFDVAIYDVAKFEITAAQEGVKVNEALVMKDATHTVTGNLTMKGITKSISFPAKIVMGEDALVAHAEFNIDRTQWGIVYGNDKSLGNKFINPEVNLTIHLEASK